MSTDTKSPKQQQLRPAFTLMEKLLRPKRPKKKRALAEIREAASQAEEEGPAFFETEEKGGR